MLTNNCKGGCGRLAVQNGWCAIKWSSGKKYGVNCPAVELRRRESISAFRLEESRQGRNPMQHPDVCAKNHSLERAKKISLLLKERGRQGILPQQIESREAKDLRRKRVSLALNKLFAEGVNPRQRETPEARRERMAKVSTTLSDRWRRGELSLSFGKILYRDHVFRSGWEAVLARFLDAQDEFWEYESKRIPYFNTESGCWRTTIPDFYLPSRNLILEVKGFKVKSPVTQDKMRWIRDFDYEAKLIEERHIQAILEGRVASLQELVALP